MLLEHDLATGGMRFPRGWHGCRRCSLAVPLRETMCTLCLFEVAVLMPEQGWACAVCGTRMTGRRPTARYCSERCTGRAHYRRRKVAASVGAAGAR
jgi:predicted nucleic acid-binding Zn ribbon protein